MGESNEQSMEVLTAVYMVITMAPIIMLLVSHYTATFMAYKREDIDAMSYDARASFMDRLISEPREPAAAVEDSSCIADPDDPDAYDLIMGFMENFLAKNILFHLHLDTIRAGTRAAISGTAFLLLMIGVTALD